jgi:type III secretion protein L
MKATKDVAIAPDFRPLGPVVRADEAKTWFSAAAYLAEAQRLGDQITAEAREAMEEEHRRGFETGRLAGVEEAARLIAETKAAADKFAGQLRDDLIELVVQIVREILDEFEPEELAARTVAKALQRVRIGSGLTILTAPEEADALRQRLAVLLQGGDLLRVEPDPRVAARRCVLWSEFGQVEVSVDTQLQHLAMALRWELDEAPP